MATHILEKWLDANNENKSDFAARIEVSRMAVWRVINGQELSLDMLRKVSEGTNGEVDIASLVGAISASQDRPIQEPAE